MRVPRLLIALAALVGLVGHLAVTSGDAEARRRGARTKRGRRNMPTDWTWPPSKVMNADGKRCLAHLDALGVAYEKTTRRRKVATPVLIPSMEIAGLRLEPARGKGPWVMDCHLAEALADGGAAALRAAGVATIRFIGLYEYRNVRLKKRVLKVLSRHALGLAIDIGSFVDEGGVEHVVTIKNYRGPDPLLRAADRALHATGLFRGPLTPGNDPRSHYDHFHLEARTGRELAERARATPADAEARAAAEPGASGATAAPLRGSTPIPRF